MPRGNRGNANATKRLSHSGKAYHLRSAPESQQEQGNAQSHDRSVRSTGKSAILSVTSAYISVLENLTKKKSPPPPVVNTPAPSLGRPNDSSTPASIFPKPRELTEVITRQSFAPNAHNETPQSSRGRSRGDSTLSNASCNVIVVERDNEADLYVDESHVYGTSVFEQKQAGQGQSSLVFTADQAVRRALLKIFAEEEEFPNRGEEPIPAPTTQVPAPEISNQPGAELEDVVVEQEEDRATQEDLVEDDEDDEDSEDYGDPMTTRQLLAEATENLAARQAHTSETQLKILKRQEELDLLFQQQALKTVTKTEVASTHRAEVHDATCAQASVNETKNMAEIVQNVMEASNDRWHKIVESLPHSCGA